MCFVLMLLFDITDFGVFGLGSLCLYVLHWGGGHEHRYGRSAAITGKRDSIHDHLLEAVSETANVRELNELRHHPLWVVVVV